MYVITQSYGQYFLLKCCKPQNSTVSGTQYPKTENAKTWKYAESKMLSASAKGYPLSKARKTYDAPGKLMLGLYELLGGMLFVRSLQETRIEGLNIIETLQMINIF
jgi:hypothetical protein